MAIRNRFAAAGLALATVLGTGAAQAAISINVTPSDLPLPAGQQMVVDFDHPNAAHFTFVQQANAYTRQGSLGLDPGVSAPPPSDASMYETVTSGGKAYLISDRLLKSFSFYLGSPDDYNWVRFQGPSYDLTLSGADLFAPPTAFNGDQSVGRRISYDFGGYAVDRITFGSDGNSFEFDDLATGSAAPEPGVWAMMLVGLFGLGGLLRGQRRVPAGQAARASQA
jgi:MYXO-CTERM domain-containing protein